jgi:pilus assembly protein CpaB
VLGVTTFEAGVHSIMRRRAAFFLFSGTAALAAAIIVYSALRGQQARIRALSSANISIAVAASDVPAGMILDRAAIKMALWPRSQLPEGVTSDPQTLIGKVARTAIPKNIPFVVSSVEDPGSAGGILSASVPEGMRAVAIAVDEVGDVAGFIQPHSKVDVVLSAAAGSGEAAGVHSKIVVQNLEVLAVAQTLETKDQQAQVARVVTLLVTPIQAERLANANQMGVLRLALRNYKDGQIVLTRAIDMNDVMNADTPKLEVVDQLADRVDHARARPPAIRRPRRVPVEILRNGTSSAVVEFVDPSAERTREQE